MGAGDHFEQILFLDNFYENVSVDEISEENLVELLEPMFQSQDDYIKRSAFKIASDLSLSKKIENPFFVLKELYKFLKGKKISLQTIAVKYVPFFQEMYTNETEERIKELSNSENGDLSSQAYFCLGLFHLTKATQGNVTVEDTVSRLEFARPYFEAATQAVENRVDADFYLQVIEWLESTLTHDGSGTEIKFNRIRQTLITQNLYDFGASNLELDFLIFQFIDSLSQSLRISQASDRWTDVKSEVESLLLVYEELRKLKESTSSSSFLTKRFFHGVITAIEDGIYKVHLASNKNRFDALKEKEESVQVIKFLEHLSSVLSDGSTTKGENYQLLAVLCELEGATEGRKRYDRIVDKTDSVELLQQMKFLCEKYKKKQPPFISGSIQGQEVYNTLRNRVCTLLSNYPEEKLDEYFKVVEELIRYARASFVDSDRKSFSFLYSESKDFKMGKGQEALEQDLQDSMLRFFEHSSIKGGLDHEKERFVDGGRVDIVYKNEIITVSIELKKSLNRPSKEDIETKDISQAQTYTAGYDQLGLFVLLELSDKAREAPANFKDWFSVHHLPPSTDLEISYPDLVVSVVIPGNRMLPSSKSKYT